MITIDEQFDWRIVDNKFAFKVDLSRLSLKEYGRLCEIGYIVSEWELTEQEVKDIMLQADDKTPPLEEATQNNNFTAHSDSPKVCLCKCHRGGLLDTEVQSLCMDCYKEGKPS